MYLKKAVFLFGVLFSTQGLQAQQLAFPEAEGFGRFAQGGRGGAVYHVTNLNDTGPGSFRDAVSQPKRTVVFDLGGVIHIKEKISAASDLTIAGQTAPGEGIVVYGNGISFSGNSIVRYIRFRGSAEMARGACTVVADNLSDLILDHVSIGWGRWDNLHIKNSKKVTLQHCLIGEGIQPQRFGALFENPEQVTVHHCLWIHNQSRNPKAKAGIEYINNVIYNWGSNGFVGGHSGANHYQDVLNNYFIAGPGSTDHYMGQFSATDHVYAKGNKVDLDKDGRLNGQEIGDQEFKAAKASVVSDRQVSSGAVQLEDAEEAFQRIVREGGASLKRDAIDRRLIGDLKSLGKKGQIVMTEQEAGGQGPIKGGKAAKDSDQDGIPDVWEKKHGLAPTDAADAQKQAAGSEYSNLEVYLNQLVSRKG